MTRTELIMEELLNDHEAYKKVFSVLRDYNRGEAAEQELWIAHNKYRSEKTKFTQGV